LRARQKQNLLRARNPPVQKGQSKHAAHNKSQMATNRKEYACLRSSARVKRPRARAAPPKAPSSPQESCDKRPTRTRNVHACAHSAARRSEKMDALFVAQMVAVLMLLGDKAAVGRRFCDGAGDAAVAVLAAGWAVGPFNPLPASVLLAAFLPEADCPDRIYRRLASLWSGERRAGEKRSSLDSYQLGALIALVSILCRGVGLGDSNDRRVSSYLLLAPELPLFRSCSVFFPFPPLCSPSNLSLPSPPRLSFPGFGLKYWERMGMPLSAPSALASPSFQSQNMPSTLTYAKTRLAVIF